MSTRVCNKCNIEKPFSEYAKELKGKFGIKSICKECRKKHHRVWAQANKERLSAIRKKRYERDAEKEKLRSRLYSKNNRERKNAYFNNYVKERRDTDPLYKLKWNTRNLIMWSFKENGYKKDSKTQKIVGCSFVELKKHLENKFSKGMSWDNQGDWHIDHIIPQSAAESKEEVIKLNHYTNLQPLWAKDNLLKAGKYNPKDKEEYLKWYKENISKE